MTFWTTLYDYNYEMTHMWQKKITKKLIFSQTYIIFGLASGDALGSIGIFCV